MVGPYLGKGELVDNQTTFYLLPPILMMNQLISREELAC